MTFRATERLILVPGLLALGFFAGMYWANRDSDDDASLHRTAVPAIERPGRAVAPAASSLVADNKSAAVEISPVFPTVADLSAETLEKLNLSCLRPDLTIDPMLAEIANLDTEQLRRLEEEIQRFQIGWAERESQRAIAVVDGQRTGVVIPPDPGSAVAARAAFQGTIESITGKDRAALVGEALGKGMIQATGDFGSIPRIVTFERDERNSEEEPIRVRISIFEGLDPSWNPDGDGDWSKLAAFPPTRGVAFGFRDLPPQFAPFVEEPAPPNAGTRSAENDPYAPIIKLPIFEPP